jgi:hypothetical protein
MYLKWFSGTAAMIPSTDRAADRRFRFAIASVCAKIPCRRTVAECAMLWATTRVRVIAGVGFDILFGGTSASRKPSISASRRVNARWKLDTCSGDMPIAESAAVASLNGNELPGFHIRARLSARCHRYDAFTSMASVDKFASTVGTPSANF